MKKENCPKIRTLCECGCGEYANLSRRFIKGHHHRVRSEETIKNMSKAHMGQIAWNKGLTAETDDRILAGDDHVRGMLNKTHSEASRNAMSEAHKNRELSPEMLLKYSELMTKRNNENWKNPEYRKGMTGENNPNWQGGDNEYKAVIRSLKQYKKWRKLVFIKDKNTCQICGETNINLLETHHIERFIDILYKNNIRNRKDAIDCEELWDTSNGMILCEECHKQITKHTKHQIGHQTAL